MFQGCKAHIAEAMPPYADTFKRISDLNRSYTGAISEKPPKDPATDPAGQTMFAALAKVVEPLVVIPDTIGGRTTLRGAIPELTSNTTLADFDKTFVSLVQSDKPRAQMISATLKKYATAISDLSSQFVRATIKVQAVQANMDNIASSMTAIPVGIQRFARGAPSSDPVDPSEAREQVIQEWSAVEQMASKYLTFVSIPGLGAGQRKTLKADTIRLGVLKTAPFSLMEQPVKSDPEFTPAALKDAFGPPSYAESTLPVMSATTGKIVAEFDKFLKLPYTQ